MNRRRFMSAATRLAPALASAAGIFSNSCSRNGPPITGSIVGASHSVGHLLRSGTIPAPTSERRTTVAIVGGGISGLSAAWKLQKSGLRDFEILELESEIGGNARSGRNQVSAYPWGAHYVPMPPREARAVRELFEELGVISGHDSADEPIYDERYLCFAPQERLFIHGRWQEGLLPLFGATRRDNEEFDRFRDLILSYRNRKCRDRRRAFAIPMEYSSRDEDLLALDRISTKQWLIERGFQSRRLYWYVNYACRDDYGSDYGDVSAWAGIHYFASRDVGGNLDSASVLTWPEGNGWIVRKLREKLKAQINTGNLVYRISMNGGTAEVSVYLPKENRSVLIRAEDVVVACPRFLGRFLLSEAADVPRDLLSEFEYAPWLVANLTLRSFPAEDAGAPLAWDNVIYESDALGYVVATHQSLASRPLETVFTYYHALSKGSAATQRARLLSRSWEDLRGSILSDLSRPHPEIESLVKHLDVVRWGHAMIRPRPGFIWGTARQRCALPKGSIFFANSDLSGISIFEEAQYRGVLAAERILERHRARFTSSL